MRSFPMHRLLFVGMLVATVARPGDLRSQAIFELGTVDARPGENVPLPLEIAADEAGIFGWSAVIHYDPSVMTVPVIENQRTAEFFRFESHDVFTEPGTVAASCIYSFFSKADLVIEPSRRATVAHVRICVLPGAAAGVHAVTLGTLATGQPGKGPASLLTAYVPLVGENDQLPPETRDGTVHVGGSEVPGSPCEPDVFDHLPPPDEPVVSYSITGPDAAGPGEAIELAWSIDTNVELHAYSAAMAFDESALALTGTAIHEEWLGNDSFQWTSAGQGTIAMVVITDFYLRDVLPRGTARPAAAMQFRVALAPPGDTARCSFVESVERQGPDGGSATVHNQVSTIDGKSPDPGSSVKTIEVGAAGAGAVVKIRRAGTFLRGDANRDSRLDIADPIALLGRLFLGDASGALPCDDAADANDDGRIDISDPVAVLGFLFLGGIPLPLPGAGAPGEDPTPDALDCLE